jgi:O-antigen/teichoic acid export membrane protein
MRSKNSILNIIVNIGSQFINILLGFVCRTVFIRTLGEAYLGVSGLFSNILTLLSLAELGVGTAIAFSMYKPLAENDHKKIGALMGLYKRTYQVIGLTVAAFGLAFTPFYPYFIKNPPDIPNLTVIYLLYVFNSVITYFFSYKQTIINADQKNYICTLYQYSASILQNAAQIFVLLKTRNFILYLCTQIVFSFISNLLLSRKANKMYPYLKTYEKEKLSRTDKNSITKNIKAMFMHRLGSVVVNGTDTLVMSSLVGIISVGIYANYYLITNTLRNLTQQIFAGVTASVGNLGAVEDRKKSHRIYLSINFAGFWIFSFCSICLICLFNPFMTLWMGRKDLLFSMPVVFFIVLNFYATGMRQATLTFKDSFGLFWYDRYKAVAEALVNLIVSILLTHQFGVIGIFIGTFISTMTVDFWVEPLVLFRHGFQLPVRSYFTRYAFYAVLTAAAGFLTWFSCSFVPGAGIGSFATKLIICLLLPNSLYLLIFWKSEEFEYLKGFFKLRKPGNAIK